MGSLWLRWILLRSLWFGWGAALLASLLAVAMDTEGRSSALRASLFAFAVHAESASSALAAFRSHEAMLASGASATQITCSLPAAMRTETRPPTFATSAFDASVLAALVDNHGAEDTTEK